MSGEEKDARVRSAIGSVCYDLDGLSSDERARVLVAAAFLTSVEGEVDDLLDGAKVRRHMLERREAVARRAASESSSEVEQ